MPRVLLIVLALLLAAPATARGAETRHSLAGGCFLVATADGGYLARQGETGWTRSAPRERATPLRAQATALGRYLLMAPGGRFVAASRGVDGVLTALREPAAAAVWTAASGALLDPSRVERVADARCAEFPEAETNVEGTPYRSPTHYSQVKGLIETHLHGMAFEFLGGSVHCGRPWHPMGAPAALVDCPDHGPGGSTAVAENFLAYGNPAAGHDTDGWPTFKGWPTYRTYTHEQVYWKWLERAWRGGLRLYTNLLVDNEVLCEVYPLKRNPCNEMENVRLQARQLIAMRDYIDAQSGGPGKGFLQIVRDPYEARRVIAEGKLALVMGIETSKLFDCGEYNGVPTCTREQIDLQLDQVHAMGVRQMELVNKTDNGLVGVAGDEGTFGILTNTANLQDTGHFWRMGTCTGPDPEHDHDKEQTAQSPALARDELAGGLLAIYGVAGPTLPAYPPGPHCNAAGLTPLGAYTIRRMMEKRMLFDPDHMSVAGRDQALSVVEAAGYGGVLSSHSWSTPDAYRRIQALGGVVTPHEKSAEGFIREWTALKPFRNPKYFYGTGFSTDMNGFASQGGPRAGNDKNPVVYPFKSLDGSTTIHRNRAGTKTWDLNTEGTAHFGLYPDRIEDIRVIGGEEVARDLLNGAEAYLQMWERADGVPGPACKAAQRRLTSRGFGEIRVGDDDLTLLRSAGQPQTRTRVWTWCVNGTGNDKAKVLARLTEGGRVEFVGSDARLHRAPGGVRVGTSARSPALRGTTRRAGGLLTRRAGRSGRVYVYRVVRGRVTALGVASASLARSPAELRAAVRSLG